LHKTAQAVCLIGDGPYPTDICLVGEAPGYREDNVRKPFAGKAGRLLDSLLDAAGLDRRRLFITNAVHCRPPENRKPTTAEIETCHQYLKRELDYVKPKLILALGNVALRSLLGKQAPNVTSARGRVFTLNGARVVGTYHPAAALRTPYLAELIIDDFKRALRHLQRTPSARPTYNYTLVDSKNFTAISSMLLQTAEPIALDIETTALDMYDPHQRLLSFALSPQKGEAYCFLVHHNKATLRHDQLERFLTVLFMERPVIGHNVKFDLRWIYQTFNIKPYAARDTRVMLHLLDENYPDKELKHLTLIHTKMGPSLLDWERQVKGEGRFTGFARDVRVEPLVNYNCGDADATRQLHQKFLKWLQQEELVSLLQFQDQVTRMLLDVELAGFTIDRGRRAALTQTLTQTLEQLTLKLRQGIRPDLNVNSTQQLADVLFTRMRLPVLKQTPTGKPAVDEMTLEELSRSRNLSPKAKEWLTNLIQYRQDHKIYTVYLEGLDVKADGRVHPNYKQTGTVTGRLSCADPNLQQIPREGPVKSMFISRFKHGTILQMDYNQVELRVLAHYSRDPGLLEAFRTGRDIHRAVAARVFRKPEAKVTEQERKFTKQVNFGIAYCITEYGLASKLNISEDEAWRHLDDWHREFPRVREWWREIRQTAQKYHLVWTEFGRRRRFVDLSPNSKEGREALRQAVNFPVQSLASDITVFVMTELWKALMERSYQSCLVANVHDAIIVDCHPREVRHVAKLMRSIAEAPPLEWRFKFKLRVPLVAELKSGPTWGTISPWRF
jgi:DNA polymerase-1